MNLFRKNLKSVLWLLLMILSMLVFNGCSSNESSDPIELHIMIAASMTDAMNELIELYENQHKGVQIIPSFGSSGQLKTQIELGAPADLFLSAAVRWLDELEHGDFIKERHDLLRNELVLVQQQDANLPIQSFEDLSSDAVGSISIGLPDTVPAGEYAKQALESMSLYEKIESKMIYASDVRQVLTYVETGNVDVGLVYKTDAVQSNAVEIVLTANPDTHDSIIYPIGLLSTSEHPEEAQQFYEWLLTPEAEAIFEKYGFSGV